MTYLEGEDNTHKVVSVLCMIGFGVLLFPFYLLLLQEVHYRAFTCKINYCVYVDDSSIN